MRFLVDECVGPSVVRWLRDNNYDATSAYEDCRGWDDGSILEKAFSEERIVVTLDKDFGDMVFRMKLSHCGIILLRCGYCSPAKKISTMKKIGSPLFYVGDGVVLCLCVSLASVVWLVSCQRLSLLLLNKTTETQSHRDEINT